MKKLILMSSGDIRRRLKVSRQRTYQIMARESFPAPYQVLDLGRVWDAEEVEQWIRTYRPALARDATTGM